MTWSSPARESGQPRQEAQTTKLSVDVAKLKREAKLLAEEVKGLPGKMRKHPTAEAELLDKRTHSNLLLATQAGGNHHRSARAAQRQPLA